MIYLDYQATTPLAPEVEAAMAPWLGEKFANPHAPYTAGREAAATVEVARKQVMRALGKTSGRLAFTGSATEALNWALKGSVGREGRDEIVTIATEHAAVLDTVQFLGSTHKVHILPVDHEGIVDLDALRAAVGPRTALVAAMLVNNEIGVLQPVDEIASIAHEAGALMLCDAVQGLGRIAVPEQADLIAISAHKVHGPKAIGALWMADSVEPAPLIHGGGQELGLRSGTLSPALCAGFGAAASLIAERAPADHDHVESLWEMAHERMRDWTLNGSAAQRYHGNLNLRRDGLDAARLMSEVRGVAFSLGSACASGSGRPSHVLRALGLSDREARSSIRIGFGRYTTADELAEALDRIDTAAKAQ
ncbi:cysteine desulfurase family protein [Sphingomicrobium aestuariivivum]|uniref:cysteine desulfurase family protein n=1 Tax=Sphingomicrobium aestuariivivum TaxID=1582356 RepID=UPI001FD6E4D9|nr:cysteine desulfurase family protein [Sphingomicrobium aestuariivivum]MCJ8189875.1 cysteine desulfurase [Sphingomicrobium aestuariivivum]